MNKVEEIKREEFLSTPAHKELMLIWLKENKNKITIVGETRRAYLSKTKVGKPKPTDTEVITIYYREK